MAYVPHFQHDALISYAHDNNQPRVKGEEGWITKFHKSLELQIRNLIEKPYGLSIWRDKKLQGNDTFDESIQAAVRTSVVFVSIFLPQMTRDQLRAAIQEPVEVHGGAISERKEKRIILFQL